MPTVRCPICRGPVDLANRPPSFPFCSARCRQIDLNRWLVEGYSITTLKPVEEDDEDPGPAAELIDDEDDG